VSLTMRDAGSFRPVTGMSPASFLDQISCWLRIPSDGISAGANAEFEIPCAAEHGEFGRAAP
jgi:hypothetical protein